MQFFLFVVVLTLVAVSLLATDVDLKESVRSEEQEITPEKSLDEFRKMSVKALKTMLKDKGLDCKGCSEKSEFVEKAYTSQNLPSVEATQEEPTKIPPGVDQDKLDELMASLKKGGFGNSKMYTAEDFKNMSPEDMNEKFRNDKSSKSKGKGKKSKPSSTKKTGDKKSSKKSSSKSAPKAAKKEADINEDGETIEL